MATFLEQLKTMTVVVADTGDMHSMKKFKPRDATTNPSLLTAAAKMSEYAPLVDEALGYGKTQAEKTGKGGDTKTIVDLTVERLAIEFGSRILDIVPGRVSTEVDARLSYDTDKTVAKAHDLIEAYAARNIGKDRILIKIASTWEGIQASRILEKEGIHCNMTLLFGIHQAVACAEAGATLISPFVGRILDWYKKDTGKASYEPSEDPGVLSVTRIYEYYKHHGYKTEVMGASFRNMGEITELAGCDLLTISPQLLGELDQATGDLPRKLDPEKAKATPVPKIAIDEAAFRKLHAEDRMATDKLKEGIDGFTKSLVELEEILAKKLG